MAVDVRLMTLDPGHFHAGLIQKEMYPGVAPRVDVFAPLGPDLIEHLKRITAFNTRAEKPTGWSMEVHAGPDYLERMLRERPGNVVVLSGRNKPKIDRITAAVQAGLHVLADKPWILEAADLPKLEAALAEADARGTVAYDIMTERFEITSILQRALVNDPATFGAIVPGTEAEPGVYMESVHYLMKLVAGAPNIRPPWFFDSSEQGEGLNDVGTHLVDLVQWTLFPDQAIDHHRDVRILAAQRWPTWVPEEGFRRVTGEPRFPASLAKSVKDETNAARWPPGNKRPPARTSNEAASRPPGDKRPPARTSKARLEYYCNTLVLYALRGVHTKLNVIWDWEAPPGSGDTHYAFYRGTKARIEVRQTRDDNYRPELYVIPAGAASRAQVRAAVQAKIESLRGEYPGLEVHVRGSEIHVAIPDTFRVGHEAHFGQVTANFLKYLEQRSALPAWERPNMVAKYFVSTKGTELSRQGPPRPAPRIAPQ